LYKIIRVLIIKISFKTGESDVHRSFIAESKAKQNNILIFKRLRKSQTRFRSRTADLKKTQGQNWVKKCFAKPLRKI